MVPETGSHSSKRTSVRLAVTALLPTTRRDRAGQRDTQAEIHLTKDLCTRAVIPSGDVRSRAVPCGVGSCLPRIRVV